MVRQFYGSSVACASFRCDHQPRGRNYSASRDNLLFYVSLVASFLCGLGYDQFLSVVRQIMASYRPDPSPPGQDDSCTELSLVPCTIAASAPSREFIRRNKAGHEGVCRMTCGTHIPQLEGRRPPEKSWLGGGGVGSVYSVADGFEFAFYFEEHIDYNRVELGA